MSIKQGDFVQLHFTGRTADDQTIFDTTREDVAKEHGLYRQNMTFEPITICVGEGFLLEALDDALVGKEPDATFSITLSPEQAFGKKRADHLKLMPIKAFKKQQVQPRPGLEVTIDNVHGTIKSVQGNRVIVDFNHPLAGKSLEYELALQGTVDDVKAQVEAVVGRTLGFAPEIALKDKKATLTLPVELPEEVRTQITEKVTGLTAVEAVDFAVESGSNA